MEMLEIFSKWNVRLYLLEMSWELFLGERKVVRRFCKGFETTRSSRKIFIVTQRLDAVDLKA